MTPQKKFSGDATPSPYVLLPTAEEDLLDSTSYLLENSSDEIALRYVRAVYQTSSLLAQMPGIGMRCLFSNPQFASMRTFPVKRFPRWLIFYQATKTGVQIVRVLHSSRDRNRLFR